jgi:nucleotide-binding universal stress UspA family protein
VYIDATSVRVADRKSGIQIRQLIREALHPFDTSLERLEVHVTSIPGGHVCHLCAWTERGQTVFMEGGDSSILGAIETAAGNLKQAMARLAQRGMVAAAAGTPATEPPRRTSNVTCNGTPSSRAGLAPSSHGPTDGTERAATPRPRVLLALQDLAPLPACLDWAKLLANALSADLEVCRLWGDAATAGAAASTSWLDGTRRQLAATRETRRWCATFLPEAVPWKRLIPSESDVVPETARQVRETGVDWIVLQHRPAGSGVLATALARASGRPVLVAREPTRRSTLLVATDVDGDLQPLWSRTAVLAEALHAPVLAFHNVVYRASGRSSRVDTLLAGWSQLQAERLQVAGHQRLPDLEVLLAHGSDRVETILNQARREDAEIIVVAAGGDAVSGAQDDLAAAVVDRAVRSVLVVPAQIPDSHTRVCAAGFPRRASGTLRSAAAVQAAPTLRSTPDERGTALDAPLETSAHDAAAVAAVSTSPARSAT